MDGHFRPALLGRLCRRVDLKTGHNLVIDSSDNNGQFCTVGEHTIKLTDRM